MNAIPLANNAPTSLDDTAAEPNQAIRRILLIDDNRGDRLLCERHLRRIPVGKYECVTASCAAEAREIASTGHFDAVLLDYFLPDTIGLNLVRQLRKLCGDPELPVLLLTGAGDEELAAHVLTRGVDDYLPKNRLSARVLQRALGNALEKAELKRQSVKDKQLLEASNKQLTERNEQIRQIYHTVSHELKTPLTAIREYNSLILDGIGGTVSSEQQDFLKTSIACCDRLTRMVDDLRDTARIEQGKLSLELRPCNLGELVSNLSTTFELLAKKEQVNYRCNIAQPLPDCLLDSDRITQLITNLVNNAVRHTEAGGTVTVEVRLDPSKGKDSDSLLLSVTDTGCGISPEEQASIFGRYVQANEDMTPDHQGMGIGLYLCETIAALHNGSITLDSELGLGSRFTATLPVQRVPQND